MSKKPVKKINLALFVDTRYRDFVKKVAVADGVTMTVLLKRAFLEYCRNHNHKVPATFDQDA